MRDEGRQGRCEEALRATGLCTVEIDVPDYLTEFKPL